jgi:adenosylcobinamide-GDP ribazoletransferase
MNTLRPALAAVSFLTRVPAGRLLHVEAVDIARGVWLFPVVGGLVGGGAGLLADVAASSVPAFAAGALAVGAVALVTGAMHLDALADTADALGAASRERALEIMRDPAVGAFGVIVLIVVCVLDAALLGALAQTHDAALVGLAAGAAGRAAMLPPALVLPYARSGEGQGRVLARVSVNGVVLGVVMAVLLSVPAGHSGVAALAAAALMTAPVTVFFHRRFGGVTGDTLGATAKLAETAALLAAVAVAA